MPARKRIIEIMLFWKLIKIIMEFHSETGQLYLIIQLFQQYVWKYFSTINNVIAKKGGTLLSFRSVVMALAHFRN